MKDIILFFFIVSILSSCGKLEIGLLSKDFSISLEGMQNCNGVTDMIQDESTEEWEEKVLKYIEGDLNLRVNGVHIEFEKLDDIYFCGLCYPTGYTMYLDMNEVDMKTLIETNYGFKEI